jgi:hypothetical protein
MKKNTEFKFTFETENEYEAARCTGYIDLFDIVRMKVSYGQDSVDYPIRSREEFEKELVDVPLRNGTIVEIYQAQHYYDMADYD